MLNSYKGSKVQLEFVVFTLNAVDIELFTLARGIEWSLKGVILGMIEGNNQEWVLNTDALFYIKYCINV